MDSGPDLVQWLLEGPPWVAFRARLDLLSQAADEPPVETARQAMLADPKIQALVAELAAWPGTVLTSHKSAGHALHKLAFLADLGLKASDPGMDAIVERILAHRSSQGPFQVLMNIPSHFGGTGQDQYAWALCDAPSLVYALLKFGLGEDKRVQQALAYLASLLRQNGWPCAVSPELGRFRGPGRKEDPCPYANLLMLKVLAQSPDWRESHQAQLGVESALAVWAERRSHHPYLFYMGDDFCKLKAPMVWYDILHVVDVLTQFPWLQNDPRLIEMLALVQGKASQGGVYTPESIWTAWKDWEFGQKKSPSAWVTLVATRALQRHSSSRSQLEL